MSEVVKYHESEQVNKPHWKRFKLQGKNKYLALAHKNTEIKYYMTGPNGEQIVIEQPDRDISQDEPTTATVVAMSKDWDYENYPDVKIGCNIETTINSWYTWTRHGRIYASGDAESIIAVYDWSGNAEEEIQEAIEEAERKSREAVEKADQAMIEAAATNPTAPIPSLIRMDKPFH
jgi:hypothetical protein